MRLGWRKDLSDWGNHRGKIVVVVRRDIQREIEKAMQDMERAPIEAQHAHRSYVLGLCTGLLRAQ